MNGPDSFHDISENDDVISMLKNRKTARQLLAEEQTRHGDISFDMSNEFQEKKRELGVTQAMLNDLRGSNEALYKYVSHLENVFGHIWCVNCNCLKTVPGKHEQVAKKADNWEEALNEAVKGECGEDAVVLPVSKEAVDMIMEAEAARCLEAGPGGLSRRTRVEVIESERETGPAVESDGEENPRIRAHPAVESESEEDPREADWRAKLRDMDDGGGRGDDSSGPSGDESGSESGRESGCESGRESGGQSHRSGGLLSGGFKDMFESSRAEGPLFSKRKKEQSVCCEADEDRETDKAARTDKANKSARTNKPAGSRSPSGRADPDTMDLLKHMALSLADYFMTKERMRYEKF